MIRTAQLRFVAPGFAIIVALFSAAAIGAPAVQQVSGTFAHKASVTISGSGFGSKAQAAPVVWDDASGSNVLAKWSGAWPDNNPAYNTTYRAPQRGVALPHGNITKYIAGAHAEGAGATGGYNVIFFKNITINSYPAQYYVSWYSTVDPAWSFGGDENFKTFAYSSGNGPYGMPNNWYVNYGPPTMRPPGNSQYPFPYWQINDDGSSLQNPDINGKSSWWYISEVNPITAWAKNEIAVRLSTGNDGYIKQWENGRLVINYQGPTDKYPGSSRTIGIGGYARNYNKSSNWRYFADVYLDSSLSRVVLANNPILGDATVIENQIPTAWGTGSIGLTVNLGKFTSGQTAYLFVVDASGSSNSTGYPVTVGEAEVKPNAPEGVVVQ
jgi:hypothetical protein